MAGEWFYAERGQQLGPVALDALAAMLRDGQLAATDLVWRQGMPNWVEARLIPELAPHAPAMPAMGAFPQGQPGVQQMQYHTPRGMEYGYAGFWLRFVAWIIDLIILWIPIAILSGVTDHLLELPVFRPRTFGPGSFIAVRNFGNFWEILICWLYFALLESSQYQATLGKIALGLIVTDENGRRLTFGRATGRNFAKYISQMTCGIGYIVAGFTQRKQALHDIIARTLVVRRGMPRM